MSRSLDIAKSVTEGELEYISKADYGQDSGIHKEALRKLIFEQHCIVNDDQYWFPYEVVELTRWRCKEGHEREFAICNIIIALSILAGTDLSNDPSDMIDTIAPEYDKLPEELRETVINILIQANEKNTANQ